MDTILQFILDAVAYVLNTLVHNAPVLAVGILVAAAMQTYVDHGKLKDWLMRRSSVSIPASVAFGAFTPLCACGTMAVILAMLATALPWGPVMAFLTSSPLMSPEGFVMMSAMLGLPFAVALAAASVLIGLGAGYVTHILEKKTRFLDNQLRFSPVKQAEAPACGCGQATQPQAASPVSCCAVEESRETENCGCGETAPACGCGALALEPPPGARKAGSLFSRWKLNKLLRAAFDVGIVKILPMFALFAGVGYAINRLIPSEWISALFGSKSVFSVPLAALVGLPLYVNGESAIPLVQSLMASGVGPGAMLAFMITGPGTSAGVLAGIATILKRKALALYTAYLLVGAVAVGYVYELIQLLVR